MRPPIAHKHALLPVDIGRFGHALFIVLFVASSAMLQITDLIAGSAIAAVYIAARFVGKSVGVLCFAHLSGIRPGSGGLLSIALLPMSGIALAIVHSAGSPHPFHKWNERRIYPTERFTHLLEVYGYLAKQFTVFGQHVHIGCPDGNAAIYLTHVLSRYIPHFIALSASSPFQQGADTSFQSSRLNTVSPFPMSGTMPFVQNWDEFIAYFDRMRGFQIVESMKDFYWDIRPKPEYGTVAIRVLDTPLTVERAALLAAYAQMLAHYAFNTRPLPPSADVYLVYRFNRFQACRYGFDASYVDAHTRRKLPLHQDMLQTLELLKPHAAEIGASAVFEKLRADVAGRYSDAAQLRALHAKLGSLNDVARCQSDAWMGRMSAPAR